MFTQMAAQIAAAGFALPMEIPYYGPGGIPFVYPPLGHYLFAAFLALGFSTWAYLRLVPAFFALAALVPFYFLARELTAVRWGGLAALLLAFTAPSVFSIHVWAAGVVRGLALILTLTGLLFYLRALRQPGRGVILAAGIALGLLLTTHLLYTLFRRAGGAGLFAGGGAAPPRPHRACYPGAGLAGGFALAGNCACAARLRESVGGFFLPPQRRFSLPAAAGFRRSDGVSLGRISPTSPATDSWLRSLCRAWACSCFDGSFTCRLRFSSP